MDGKIVLIVGASSGIGRVLAKKFASLGVTVILSSRSTHALIELEHEILESGGTCHVIPCDICCEASVTALISDSIDKFQRIDIAILGSAVQYIDRVDALRTDELEMMFQTNVVGIMRCARYILPHMLKRNKGQLVFLSSMMGEAAFPQMVPYGASKAAISCFARGLHRELKNSHVHVNLLSPGHMNTNINSHLGDRTPSWYGKSGSLDLDKAAEAMIRAVQANRKEVVIGRQSYMMTQLIKYMPAIANRIIHKITT